MNSQSHECGFYRAQEALRAALCSDCARGSQPRKPVKNRFEKAIARANYPNQVQVEPVVATIEGLDELGITPEQAEAFDKIIARSEQEARDYDAWLDAMHD